MAFVDGTTKNGYIYTTYNSYNKFNIKIDKIMSYNPKLLEPIYDELMPFESVTYTGVQINSKIDNNGYLILPRRRYNNAFCYVIMLVNGELYRNYFTMSYVNNKFKIFIDARFADGDIIELLFIKNADNTVGNINITSKDIPVRINSKFNEDNVNIFSTEFSSNKTKFYPLTDSSMAAYNIPFTTIQNEDKTYNILLEDNFYYGRGLIVVSKKQFKYKKVLASYNQVDLELGDDFKYCINKEYYMVFINGRVISKTNFDIGMPGFYSPFEQPTLYTNIILKPNDRVEVFYLPFKTYDISMFSTIPSNGKVDLGSTQLPFSLNKEHYLYFINGKKIIPDNIDSVSDNIINLSSDYKSTCNFLIMQCMSPIDILAKFISNIDNWNTIVNLIGSDITRFYQSTELTNTEESARINETDLKATMMEAYRQHYAKYSISSNPLVYDFNDILIDYGDRDPSGNFLVHVQDARSAINVDIDR
jgi:hypothetical protein